jgi:23S rRNA U2552 (ribose-2'-O)-methylase RlmE/FtsJ
MLVENLVITTLTFKDVFMENYETIFKNHDGFISHKWVQYFYIYDQLFSKYREKNKPITIMEIGVDRGGSLEIWKKYLPEGSKIHGVDINPKCQEIQFSENIYFHLGSAADRRFMEKTFADTEFDIILDDGSHQCSDVIETFEIMFPKIKNGGIYIVEDLCASYWLKYGGGYRKKGTSIEYFKNLIEALNSDYLRKFGLLHRIVKNFSRNLAKKISNVNVSKKYFQNINYHETIESVTFYNGICAIKKFSAPKMQPFKSITTGTKSSETVNCVEEEATFIQMVKKIYGHEE